MARTPNTPEEEIRIGLIRSRIASVDHDDFGADCNAFQRAVIELVPAEDMAWLLGHDPLITNLCCIFMSAGGELARQELAGGPSGGPSGGRGITITIGRVRRPRRKNDPETPPTA